MSAPTTVSTDRFLTQADAFQLALDAAEPERLKALRREARLRFAELGMPTTRLEEWRFTNIAPIAKTEFTLAGDLGAVERQAIERYCYPELARATLVNGRFSPELSDLDGLPDGVVVTSLAEALELYPEEVDRYLGRLASFDERHFVALNTAFLRDGVFIKVPRGVVVEQALNLLSVAQPDAEGEPVAFFPRILIVAEESSQIRLVEHYVTVGEGPYFSAPVTEVEVGPNAGVDHYKLERESLVPDGDARPAAGS